MKDFIPLDKSVYFASGRQAIEALAFFRNYRRIFVPSYFCRESLDRLRWILPVDVYDFIPGDNFYDTIKTLDLKSGDAILRVNYFNLNSWRPSFDIPADIIEDHTHAPVSDWSMFSDADYCIASLRKAFPVSDGGILWSPKNKKLPSQPKRDHMVAEVMAERYAAMELKHDYLAAYDKLENPQRQKNFFREIFVRTEDGFEHFPISDMSAVSHSIMESLNIDEWNVDKAKNWELLRGAFPDALRYKVLEPSDPDIVPFSFILLFDTKENRDAAKQAMITNQIYPAVLWPIDSKENSRASDFSDRMLSIHCDGRYHPTEIGQLIARLTPILKY